MGSFVSYSQIESSQIHIISLASNEWVDSKLNCSFFYDIHPYSYKPNSSPSQLSTSISRMSGYATYESLCTSHIPL